MLIIIGTVISSFFSNGVIRRIGTGKVVFISTLLTALSLLGFSLTSSFGFLLLLAFPLGLGGGAIDVSLNNYVALNYKAQHMNWLHSFWGLGATLGPMIISRSLVNSSWREGYKTIFLLQISFALIMVLALGLWPKDKEESSDKKESRKISILKTKGIPIALGTMLIYCAAEIGTGLWGSSYIVEAKGFSPDEAAKSIALYYLGITIGRFASGFFAMRFSNKQILRFSLSLAFAGSILLVFCELYLFIMIAFTLIGLGLAPIFPAMIHETPKRFGQGPSQKIIGYQMGFAYIGSATLPSLLGILYQHSSIAFMPLAVILFLVLLLGSTERLNRIFRTPNSELTREYA